MCTNCSRVAWHVCVRAVCAHVMCMKHKRRVHKNVDRRVLHVTCDSVIHSQTLFCRRRSPFLTLLLFFATPCARVCTHRASCTCFVHNASQRRVARRRGAEVVRDRCVQFAQRARNPRPCTRPRAPQPGAPCTRPGPCTNPVHATPCTRLPVHSPVHAIPSRARNPVHATPCTLLTRAHEHESSVRKCANCPRARVVEGCVQCHHQDGFENRRAHITYHFRAHVGNNLRAMATPCRGSASLSIYQSMPL